MWASNWQCETGLPSEKWSYFGQRALRFQGIVNRKYFTVTWLLNGSFWTSDTTQKSGSNSAEREKVPAGWKPKDHDSAGPSPGGDSLHPPPGHSTRPAPPCGEQVWQRGRRWRAESGEGPPPSTTKLTVPGAGLKGSISHTVPTTVQSGHAHTLKLGNASPHPTPFHLNKGTVTRWARKPQPPIRQLHNPHVATKLSLLSYKENI